MSRHHRKIPAKALARARRAALRRGKYRCAQCGRPGPRLEVDHVVPLDTGGAALDPENLQVLCQTHHIAKTVREKDYDPERAAWVEYLRTL